jgi:DNA-binding LacI/PurR family transcriptional regulator
MEIVESWDWYRCDIRGVLDLKTMVSRLVSASRFWAAISCVAGVLLAPGCDSMSFVPPRPPELSNPAQTGDGAASRTPVVSTSSSTNAPLLSSSGRIDGAGRSTGGGKIVELVLAKPPSTERLYLVQSLRRDFGKATMSLRYTKPESVQPLSPEQLAGAIRKAIQRGSAALIVEPIDDPAVRDLLYENQSRGMKVLLLDQPLPQRGGKSIPSVTYQSFDKLGRQIVETVIDAAKMTRRLNDGRIVVIQNHLSDPYSADRLASLTNPLIAAGLKYEILPFEGDANAAKEAVTKSLMLPPKIAIVLAADDDGFNASHLVLTERIREGQPEFLLGGYTSYAVLATPDLVARAVAFCDRSIEVYASKTFQTVRSLIEGKPVGERIEIPMTFHHTSVLYVPTPLPKKDGPPHAQLRTLEGLPSRN